jgi:hypothetical protein
MGAVKSLAWEPNGKYLLTARSVPPDLLLIEQST